MEAEIVQLAASGASALVGLMVNEAWSQVKPRFAALFGRGREADVAEELEETREELVEAAENGDESAARGAQAEWERRLRRALRDPQVATRLQGILDEFAQKRPEQAAGSVHNEISGNARVEGKVVQAHTIHGLSL
ncbi:hypothetical protein F7Q99_04060 [Streptomyces kaniharaensis]|uniref:Uncharacterized protein n=1 Tax=Streptomyces kaniharaensis TaxID=212423 RepID=A0A6N7KJ09_9ACTN|nr:hypothetical protein [Streptomyces kaniharaensis]MQS11480.1 hypothetical protein [Streptomyces kaniharaensis]